MQKKRVITSVLAITFARLIINMARRFAYPFIPAIGRELNVPLSYVQSVIAVQAGAGIISPPLSALFGGLSRKRTLSAVTLIMAGCSAWGALFPQFSVFAVVMVVMGLLKIIYDPIMQAYIGDHVPYQRRATAIGITELSWAGALIVSAPVAGLLLDSVWGLQSVFALLAVASAVASVLLWVLLPDDAPGSKRAIATATPRQAWRTLLGNHAALSAILYSTLFVMANEILFIGYGAWMELSFGLQLTALGAATITIAVAEVLGESLVIGAADRIGKRRLALGGTAVAGLLYMLMPFLPNNLMIALGSLFVLFVCVEISIVSSISLFTEILPEARSVMMSGNVAAHSLGRLLGALIGAGIYATIGDLRVIGAIEALICLAAAVPFWYFIKET